MISYFLVFATIILTVYGQLVLKWQVLKAGAMPAGVGEKILFLLSVLTNPWILSAFVAAFLAALSWMGALTRLELSHAYPFVGFSFALVLVLSSFFFHEAMSTPKIVGVGLIVLGIVIGSQG